MNEDDQRTDTGPQDQEPRTGVPLPRRPGEPFVVPIGQAGESAKAGQSRPMSEEDR